MKTILIMLLALQMTSCASILGGKRTEYQVKQKKGEVKKQVQVGYLIADMVLLCPVCIVVDFVTGEIYRKEPTPEAK